MRASRGGPGLQRTLAVPWAGPDGAGQDTAGDPYRLGLAQRIRREGSVVVVGAAPISTWKESAYGEGLRATRARGARSRSSVRCLSAHYSFSRVCTTYCRRTVQDALCISIRPDVAAAESGLLVCGGGGECWVVMRNFVGEGGVVTSGLCYWGEMGDGWHKGYPCLYPAPWVRLIKLNSLSLRAARDGSVYMGR
jgi:hypothetical protein